MKEEIKLLRGGPVVCVVDKYYQIMIPVNKDVLVEITVGNKTYYDHINGVRRTSCPVQRFTIPMSELDSTREYTVTYREMIERGAYSCIKGKEHVEKYAFRPVPTDGKIDIYYLSDCHGRYDSSVEAANYFGYVPDLLILNGDVSSSCATEEEVMLPFDIAFAVTKGERPCIITRGNHDLRGAYSEALPDYMPGLNGHPYYSITVGNMWFLVLDCGEDKNDDHREYSGTAAFHQMRLDETEFIKGIISSASSEYLSEKIRYRILLSHVPINFKNTDECKGERPFDIENELYSEWCSLISEQIKPDLAIAGHLHTTGLFNSNSEYNARNMNCPTLIAGKPDGDSMTGAAITIEGNIVNVKAADNKHNTVAEFSIDLK